MKNNEKQNHLSHCCSARVVFFIVMIMGMLGLSGCNVMQDVEHTTIATLSESQEQESLDSSLEVTETDDTTPESTETRPIETQPIEIQPVETEPIEPEPIEPEPIEPEPIETQPIETEPAETETQQPETEPVEIMEWQEADCLIVPDYEMPYYIKINVSCNVVNVYRRRNDDSSMCSYEPFRAFITSCGTYTLSEGVFPLSDHYEWRELYGGEYGHYAVRIYSGLMFHAIPCSAPDVDTLNREDYNALGTRASLGCMRLRDCDAKWIYENCEAGTLTEFYESEDPGPFGKPSIEPLAEGITRDPSAE